MTSPSLDDRERTAADGPTGRPVETRAYGAGGLSVLALIWVSGALLVGGGPARPFTVVGRQPGLAPWFIGAGLALVWVGIVLLLVTAERRRGLLLLLAGCCWFTPLWVGWVGAPAGPVVLAHALSAALPALLIQVAATFPTRPSRGDQAVVVAGWVAALAAVGSRLLLEDPFRDPSCWGGCVANPFAIGAAVAQALEVASVLAGATAALLGAAAVGLTRSAWGSANRRLELGLAAVGTYLLALPVSLAAVIPSGSGDPMRDGAERFWVAGCAGVVLFSFAQLLASVSSWSRRRRVSDLVQSATSPTGALESALRRAFDDPRLIIAYWLPESRRLVTSAGEEDPVTIDDLVRTEVRYEDRQIATILHTVSAADLMSSIGPTLRLRMENELLDTELAVQLEALQRSLIRVVAAGDARRRLLERDLHDGAQQHLLALGTTLQAASKSALDLGEESAAEILDSLVAETRSALQDLRALARGIFPAELENDGLAVALTSLSIDAPLPVDVELGDIRRVDAGVEAALYLCAQALVRLAWRRGGTEVKIQVVVDASSTRLICTHDVGPLELPQHLLDRVGALGGSVMHGPGVTRVLVPVLDLPRRDGTY